jgi:tripartite-type tricarboxylate transporter receptor subunit TctC
MKRREFLVIGGAAAAAFALPARAAYPDKPVRYIIAFPPGGESDIGARLQQGVFDKLYHQQLVIESKPGAGGGLAWSQLNNYPGDGSVIMGTNLPHLVLQPLEGNVQYKTDDIANVHFYHYTPDAIVVRNESPFRSYQDLLAAAKAKPGKLNFAGSGTNTANHASHERFNHAARVKSTYVPFKGTGDLIASLLGGHVDAAMSYSTLALAQKGKCRVLAVATGKRLPLFPETPTFQEVGLDWVDGAYRGIAVPRSTQQDLRRRISSMFSEINRDADFRRQMEAGGFELVDIGYDKMDAFMAERKKAYTGVAKLMGLTA